MQEFSILTGNQASALVEYESPERRDYNYTPDNKIVDDVRFDLEYTDNFYHTNQRFDNKKSK